MGAGLAFKDKVTRAIPDHQFFPTPDDGTVDVLLDSGFGPRSGVTIHEPAVGKWDIAKVLERRGHTVIGSDIKDYGEPGRLTHIEDFTERKSLRAISIITNPPYNAKDNNVGDRFIQNALDLNPTYLALLLKADFFNTAKSLKLFNATYGNSQFPRKPAAILPLTWRPDFSGQGKPFLTVTWVVFDAAVSGPTRFIPLARPGRMR
jgi:hypothetical protein